MVVLQGNIYHSMMIIYIEHHGQVDRLDRKHRRVSTFTDLIADTYWLSACESARFQDVLSGNG